MIENSDKLIKFIKSGEKQDKLLGVEIEHFILDENNNSVYYSYNNEKPGVREILEEISIHYDEKIYENYQGKQHLIGLKRNDCEVSIEPGAQFEISIKACRNINEINDIYSTFIKETNKVLSKHNYHIENIGYRPDACALEVPIIPKMRYVYMDANFKNVGTMGFCMMRCSAATQISIDYTNELDCAKKMKIASALSPLIYFLLDNSCMFEKTELKSKKTSPSNLEIPKRMVRWYIWNQADPDRCMALKEIFDNNFSYKKYAEKIYNLEPVYTPNYFSDEQAKIRHKLSMAFYDVRLKNTIEIRPADSMPIEYTLSYTELIQNLFYNEKAITCLWSMFKDVSYRDYIDAGNSLYNNEWNAEVYNWEIYDLLNKLIEIAKYNDTKYLDKIENLVSNKTCLKDYLQQNFSSNSTEFNPISKTHKNTEVQTKCFDKCKQDFKDYVKFREHSKVEYMNEVSDTGYFSKIFDINNQTQFEMIVTKTHKIIEKICDEYWSNPNYRKLFKWNNFEKKLINFRPKYKVNVPIARFDIFFNEETGQFEFCEFNTGGSAAMSKATYTCEEIQQTLPYKTVKNYLNAADVEPVAKDVYTPWVHEFKNIYKQWCGNINTKYKDNFVVGMVDFLDDCQLPDFEPFKDAFEHNGINCEICDVRDLFFDGKSLKNKNGKKFDAIYKRVTLDDLEKHKNELGVNAMIDAVFAEKVCPIDWYSSQIVHDKQLFAIMHMPQTKQILTKSEIEFIKMHIPETYILNIDIAKNNEFISNKNDYIIKPISSRDSKNIYVGKDINISKWKDVINKCSVHNNFIIQKFCKMYKTENVQISVQDKYSTLNNGVKQFCNMEGLYCYNSHFGGMYLRQGDHKKDATVFDMAVPVFYEDYKN